MTTYSAIAASEIDVDSPITTGLMTKIRDNPIAITEGSSGAPKIQTAALEQTGGSEAVTTATIRAGAVGNTELGSAAVKQGNLSTTDEEDSSGTQAQVFILSGGGYSFGPRARISTNTTDGFLATNGLQSIVYDAGTGSLEITVSLTTTNTSYVTIGDAETTRTVYAMSRYINSSPPFDLGDGEIPLFSWALLDSSGNIVSVQTSEVPPWAYNGPTDIMHDRTDKTTGRKYKKVYEIDEDSGLLLESEIEITQELKNRDMSLIPHPFASKKSDQTVVLLDPVETGYLFDVKKGGQSINELLHNDYLRLDNTPLSRAAPQGVTPTRFKWKNTQRKAGEMIRDRRLQQGPYAPEPPTPPQEP